MPFKATDLLIMRLQDTAQTMKTTQTSSQTNILLQIIRSSTLSLNIKTTGEIKVKNEKFTESL